MKFFIILKILSVINIQIYQCWTYNFTKNISIDELNESNRDLHLLEHGFVTHVARIGLRLKTNSNNEIKILNLKSRSQMSIIYSKNETELMFYFRGDADFDEKPSTWWLKFPLINLNDNQWHYIVYRFGEEYFKLWIDCKLKRNYNHEYKSKININNDIMYNFESPVLEYGDVQQIEYNKPITFLKIPSKIKEMDFDRNLCKTQFNLTQSENLFNKNEYEGNYYPINDVVDSLNLFTIPGLYYELSKSISYDVSEYFENGIDKDHSFEIVYRIKEFNKSNNTHYLIVLSSNSGARFTLSLNRKRQVLRVSGCANINGKFIWHNTEYWAHKIYNNDWHTIKYILKGGIFSLWIDGILLEDYLGFKHVDFQFNGYDKQNLWYDTELMLLEPKSKYNPDIPILNIRYLKYSGVAVTSNNTDILTKSMITNENKNGRETEEKCMFRALLKVFLRLAMSNKS